MGQEFTQVTDNGSKSNKKEKLRHDPMWLCVYGLIIHTPVTEQRVLQTRRLHSSRNVIYSPFMSSLNKQKFQRRPSLRNSVMLSGWTSIRANE